MISKVIGMDKQAALDLLHSKGYTVRIAVEDGVDNRLQGGYIPGRYTITVVDGKVTHAEEG